MKNREFVLVIKPKISKTRGGEITQHTYMDIEKEMEGSWLTAQEDYLATILGCNIENTKGET